MRVPRHFVPVAERPIARPGDRSARSRSVAGDLLFPLVSLSVAIILFEGALTLHLTELKGIGKVVRNLCSTGMVTSFAVIGGASYFLLGLDWRVAMVLGAVLVVTGPR